MVETKLIIALSDNSLEKGINQFLSENEITPDRLIDIKMVYDTFYRALIIYVKK